MKKLKTPPPAFAPPDYDAADVTAIQQLEQGTANAEMQKRALDWIIRQACRTYDVSYRPGDTHETALLRGGATWRHAEGSVRPHRHCSYRNSRWGA